MEDRKMNGLRFNNPIERVYVNKFANDLFTQLWNAESQLKSCVVSPAVNIFEAEDSVRLELLVPGFEKEEIAISLEKDQLVVRADVNESEKQEFKYSRVGFSKANFEKRFNLSQLLNKDSITAEFKNGILTIVLPKVEEEKQKIVRKIEIV